MQVDYLKGKLLVKVNKRSETDPPPVCSHYMYIVSGLICIRKKYSCENGWMSSAFLLNSLSKLILRSNIMKSPDNICTQDKNKNTIFHPYEHWELQVKMYKISSRKHKSNNNRIWAKFICQHWTHLPTQNFSLVSMRIRLAERPRIYTDFIMWLSFIKSIFEKKKEKLFGDPSLQQMINKSLTKSVTNVAQQQN